MASTFQIQEGLLENIETLVHDILEDVVETVPELPEPELDDEDVREDPYDPM